MRDDLDIPYPAAGTAQGYGQRDYRGTRMDPNTKRMAIIAGGIGGALVLMMGVWSLTGHKRSGVPLIEADSRPVRERPLDKGGLTVAGANETIMSGDTEGKAVVAPAPEAPAIAALKATPGAEAPAPATQASAEPAPATPPAPQEAAAAPARVVPLKEVPPVMASLPAARPVAPPAAPSPAQRVALTSTPPATAPHEPANLGLAHPAAGSGVTQVQLAAVSSEEAAKGEWQRLSHKYPELLGGRRAAFTRTERDGKTFWRLRVSGFTGVASATSFCGQLRSKGGNCSLASF